MPYLREGGSVGYRCSAEPVQAYVRKGGAEADTVGKACLCNALTADIGLAQTRRTGYTEDRPWSRWAPTSTARGRCSSVYPDGWSATDVITWLLG